jgi:hypothetical protein
LSCVYGCYRLVSNVRISGCLLSCVYWCNVFCVLLSSYVYFYYWFILVTLCGLILLWVHCCFTLDAGQLARSQYSEGPATGHLGRGFSWFPCVYKQMLRGSQEYKLPLHASHVALQT